MQEGTLEDFWKSHQLIDNDDPEPLPHKIDNESFKEELAFHEASHFVLASMLERYNLGFQRIQGVEIQLESLSGRLYGFAPNIPDERMHDFFLKQFYTDNKQRLAGRLLEVIAGYVSYKVFISNQEKFIGIITNEQHRLIKYFSIEELPKMPSSFDFEKAKKYLGYAGINKKEESELIFHFAIGILEELMLNPALNHAIRYVKNKLIRHEGRFIKEDTWPLLRQMVNTVQDFTKRIDLEKYIIKVVQRVEL